MKSTAACTGLTNSMFFLTAGQHDAMKAAVHKRRPQHHDEGTKGSLLRLFHLFAACLNAASGAETLAEHDRGLL